MLIETTSSTSAGTFKASRLLNARFVTPEHYDVARRTREILARYVEWCDIIAILGIHELSDEERVVAQRARRVQRFLSQPFYSTAQFSDVPGIFVPLDETVRGFNELLSGACDDLPEQAFYMVGTIDEPRAKADRLRRHGGEAARQ